ncbi:MAG: riboflavin biosynthesis protein RibF [Acidaminococcaceae bacterium]|nr:riboflavin biosynthesis protein RibF [Acidaminococcaceae bacterium]HCJ90553.1 riboflavin biosynthesis protein RibF [Acidaminococcaceae bacterium]
MKIIKDLINNTDFPDQTGGVPTVIALGTFDGLHRGHIDVISHARDYAREHGLQLAVLTFVNHPFTLINPCAVPQSLISPAEKIRKLKELGVDLLVDIPFDRQLAVLSPKQFLQQLRKLDFRCLVCGANFSYGFRGTGNTGMLKQNGHIKGFEVIVRPLLEYRGEPVSSTRIRRAIAAGDLADAEAMLGRPYSVEGIVQRGFRRGRTLGFPTANLYVSRNGTALPPGGVYAMTVQYDGKLLQGVGNLGMNPTFDDVIREVLEINLFDFHGDLYGTTLEAGFCKFLRPERRFASLDALKDQLEQDREEARRYFRDTAGTDRP